MYAICRLSTAMLIITLPAVCGCLVTETSNTTHTGTRVSPEAFNQIKSNSTTLGWVATTLGQPTSKTKTDNNDEVWKYVYTEHTDSSGAIFLIFGGSNSTEKSEIAFIEFKDGVVINKWRG